MSRLRRAVAVLVVASVQSTSERCWEFRSDESARCWAIPGSRGGMSRYLWKMTGPHRGYGGAGKPVRLPEDHRSAEASWLGCEPQEGGEEAEPCVGLLRLCRCQDPGHPSCKAGRTRCRSCPCPCRTNIKGGTKFGAGSPIAFERRYTFSNQQVEPLTVH